MAHEDPANLCGIRIKAARKALRWSQSDLSAALEVDYHIILTQSDISEIERQQRSVKDFELDAIAHILDVSLEWLVRGEAKERPIED